MSAADSSPPRGGTPEDGPRDPGGERPREDHGRGGRRPVRGEGTPPAIPPGPGGAAWRSERRAAPAGETDGAAGAGPAVRARVLPAVVAAPAAERERAGRRRARRVLVPAFVLAAALHALLVWVWYAYFAHVLLPSDELKVVQAEVDPVVDDALLVEPPPPPLEEPPEPLLDPLVEETPDESPPSDEPLAQTHELGLGASGVAGVGAGRALQGLGTGGAGDGGVVSLGDGFDRFVADLRRRGLDVVFVVDATGSMQPFVARAQQAIGDVIADLTAVVPSLHLGIVAYRDLDDPWVTRHVDLTGDHWSVRTFLLQLQVAGGRRGTPDFEEAVEVGLGLAFHGLAWREGARRVVILVGDAPYHEEDAREALSDVRDFARGDHALVNTLYVGGAGGAQPTESQQAAREVFVELAATGRGHAFELVPADPQAEQQLRRSITDATFGPQWAEDVAALLAERPLDNRLASVQRHVERGDRAWLLRRLADDQLHPAVPPGLVHLFDGAVARACLALVLDERTPRPRRSAAHWVLASALDDAREIPLDLTRPLSEQQPQAAALAAAVDAVPLPAPGRLVAPPAPPPAPPPR